MKDNSQNKFQGARTGRDILNLFKSKEKQSDNLNRLPPSNETETALFRIWASLIGHENFGVNDDFFQIGGNSLKGIQVVSRISREFLANIQLTDIFLRPTISQLAVFVEGQQKAVSTSSIINVHPRPALIPLSFSQERLWFIDRLEGSVQYHLPAVLRLKGNLDKKALENALQLVVNRHEALRTVFTEEDEQAWQRIGNKDEWNLSWIDGAGYAQNSGELEAKIDRLIKEPFDLSKDHMLRASLITLTDQEHVLVITMHHIASDGWSASVLVKEVLGIYKSYAEGGEPGLPVLETQYADYAIWQRNYFQGELLDQKLGYWKEKLQGVSSLELPTDFVRPAVWSAKGAIAHFNINKELTGQLELLSQDQSVTLFMTLLASLKVLLHRYSGQQDICVGTAIAGRQQQEVEDLIGFFVNTIPLRSEVNEKSGFTELLQQVKATTLDAYEHQEAPFAKVVDAVVKQRDMSRNPIFQVMFVLQNTPDIPELRLGEMVLSQQGHQHTTAQFDLSFSLTQTPEGLEGSVEYCSDLYTQQTIERLLDHYVQLLESIVKEPKQSIGMLPMLSEREKNHLLFDLNNTYAEYPRDKSLVDLFEEQVEKTPENTAVVFEENQLTYKELNARSNQLARYLSSKGVKADILVPICIERSEEMIVGILGILKAGGAYVPIDPEYPKERISYMLGDTAATLVISTKESRFNLLDVADLEILELDSQWSEISKLSSDNLHVPISSHHLAYAIYTSGSTGKPKGAMNEHLGVVNRLCWAQDYFKLTQTDSILQKTTFCFDVSVWELIWPLLTGARLVFAKPGGQKDSVYLRSIIRNQKITVLHFVPSMLEVFLLVMQEGDGPELKKVLCSGEALKPSQVKLFQQKLPEVELHNLYGPTEAAVDVTCWSLPDKKEDVSIIPIGKPVSNTAIYILNKSIGLVPPGGIGEIHIAGVQVGRGYLNRPDLTNTKFIKDPFSNLAEARMYKTGDLGRWLADGNIEYLGRMDDQVKIRGYRIELGEIENVLQDCDLVRQAVVLARHDKNGNNQLVGFIVAEGIFDRNAIQTYLRGKLPDYMVPVLLVEVDILPLTSNGKIDRKALLDLAGNHQLSDVFIAPRNESELKLSEIWQNLLGLERISIHGNFFQLGGHSLLAMRLLSIVRKEMGIEIALKNLFLHPTIEDFSAHVAAQNQGLLLPSLKAEGRPELIPLSFNQERLWFIDRFEGSVQYHLPDVLRLTGNLDHKALDYTLKTIVNRHEILRTVIRQEGGQPWQYIRDKDQWQLELVDGSAYRKDPNELQQYIERSIKKAFDLSRDDMMRATLVTLDESDHVLIVTMHHIASDGWSVSILVKEIMELYESYVEKRKFNLLPLEVQYADYAIWQRNYLQGEVLDRKLAYWKEKLQNVAPLELPTDFVRPAIWSAKGAMAHFNTNKELTGQLELLSQDQSVTLFMTLLASLKVLLHRYSGQQDICVGTAIAGRQQHEVEDLIGFFVNTVALRSEVNDNASFTELLRQVKATTLDAYEHQEAPFAKVVDAVVKQRDMSRNPVFQVMFVLQNTPDIPELRLGEMVLSQQGHQHTTAQVDLSFSLTQTPEGLEGSVEYCSDLYTQQTIERLLDHYVQLLESIVKEPKQSIGMLPMLSEREKNHLLFDLNNTYAEYPRDKSLVDLFEEQVEKTPENTAVVFEENQLTYKELNARSNQLAHYLTSKGLKQETLVPICLERSEEMIVGILGILKAGGAYVPIDPEYPQERIGYILEDTASALIISSSQDKIRLRTTSHCEIIALDTDWSTINRQPVHNPKINIDGRHLAYTIYTSGSTGKPKGVMIEHSSVANLLLSVADTVHFTSANSILAVTTFSFDICYLEFFMPLILGGKLIIAKRATAIDGFKLAQSISYHLPTHMQATPSTWQLLLSADWQNKEAVKMLIGGEAVKEDLKEELTKKGCLWNVYGPTETTIWSTIKQLQSAQKVVIGTPLANTSIYILNKDQQLCPVAVPGEICIGGVGLARGYLNLQELTTEKFIANPFSNERGSRLYRTGDLGRWLADGTIECLGRLDDQVKIRGHRIELGEIETVIGQYELVKQAVVVAREDKNANKRLVGYVVCQGPLDQEGVVNYLKDRLPDYMVPSLWVQLDRLPLTPNGKIDKKALPDVNGSQGLRKEHVATRTEVEQILVKIWEELLDVDKVGIEDNFFDLGGHSLLAMRMISHIERDLHLSIPVQVLFKFTTISDLSKYFEIQAANRPEEKNATTFELFDV